MGVITVQNVTIELDEDGFMQEPDKWNEDVARALAQSEDVEELEDVHWRVVNYLRDYYQKYRVAPPIRMLCRDVGIKTDEIYDYFPTGPAKGACKIAGLPKPTGCV
ncbi:MAG: TusE/DsrC/DsvC family sulfur relay protein [Polyangiaceae bacterium]|nr:TusE/DsrC/DsvC family sulfur relay protein [Polyangiaceae bacterium]